MGHTLTKIYLHVVWHVRANSWEKIQPDIKDELHRMMGFIAKSNGCLPFIINGTADHVHLLVCLLPTYNLSDVVGKIKRESSAWMTRKNPKYKNFHWQSGYAAFSVSEEHVDAVKQYIRNQEEHHHKMTFKEELIKFLEEYGVDFDPRFLLSD